MTHTQPLPDEEAIRPDEQTPLLGNGAGQGDGSVSETHRVDPRVASRLYLSHFLSTWNSRMFEFGAVLYLATIFPGTLLPMSLYALTRGLSALVFAPTVGQYIDNNDRLKVVRTSIVSQRLAVSASCVVFYILLIGLPLGDYGCPGLLALLSIMACVEKLYSIVNMVSVEKDWVIIIAKGDIEALAVLNAQIRRIDLLCKLLGPLFIALIDGFSTKAAIIVNLSMNIASVVAEYYAIANIYNDDPDLQEPKSKRTPVSEIPPASVNPGSKVLNHEVEAESRGRFSTVEAAWQNAFELLSYMATIIFFRPSQFNWPALVSVAAVMTASLAYTLFVWQRRGHLIHFEKFGL
ncbi:hypothetical protein SGCOL_006324 [Colletotrichum sp. CLE4]